jgi:hypothetical protein
MKRSVLALVGWIVLGALLLATLIAAVRFDRTGRPSLVGDEATYAMQAASLAWDFDLHYSRADFDRFVTQWGGPPDGLILQSRDNGAHLTYGKPFLYALAIAPFVRFAPVNGGLVANALFLAAAAILAAGSLRRRIGNAAPLWVAVALFASVTFGYTFWVHADIFLLATTAAGLALAYWGPPATDEDDEEKDGKKKPLPQIWGDEPDGPTPRFEIPRWILAGVLLAVAGAFRPCYLALLLPAALAAFSSGRSSGRRWKMLGSLLAGAFALLLITSLVQWSAGGDWSGYGGERQGFYPRTGYPEVDFPASQWNASIQKWGNTAWIQEGGIEPSFNPKLLGWNTLYFFSGRNVGVLPYFLPLLLGFLAWRGGKQQGRWTLPLAVGAAMLSILLIRPFNFYGGGGAIADRYFLPLYPAFWFLAARPLRAVTGVLAAALITAGAAPFLLPLWSHPTAFPIGEDGRYAHVSAFAHKWLPYETTQSHIPGGQDVGMNGIWLKMLNHNVYRTNETSLRLVGDKQGEILLGSPRPLERVYCEFGPEAPVKLEAGTLDLRPALLRPDGSITFDVPLGEPRAIHPMWWTKDNYYLYDLRLRLPGMPPLPVSLQIEPVQNLIRKH